MYPYYEVADYYDSHKHECDLLPSIGPTMFAPRGMLNFTKSGAVETAIRVGVTRAELLAASAGSITALGDKGWGMMDSHGKLAHIPTSVALRQLKSGVSSPAVVVRDALVGKPGLTASKSKCRVDDALEFYCHS